MQTLWCVLQKDTTGVDTARVRRRLRLFKNTKVGFPESLAAVDVGIIDSGVDIVVLGVAIGVLILNAFVSIVDISVLVYNIILAVDIAVLRRQ